MKLCGIIHSNKKEYKYIVITEHDLILHHYYITKWRKSMIYNIKRLGDAHKL